MTQEDQYGFLASIVGIPRLEHHLKEFLVARLDAISTALDNISTQVSQLAAQIGDLTAGQVSQEEIDALVAKAEGIAGAVDAAIEPDAGETPPDDGTDETDTPVSPTPVA